MAICKSCKHCIKETQVPQEMVVNKSWCVLWDDWQKETANQCKYYESREKDNPYFVKKEKFGLK